MPVDRAEMNRKLCAVPPIRSIRDQTTCLCRVPVNVHGRQPELCREISNPFSDTVDQWVFENQQAGCCPACGLLDPLCDLVGGSRFEYLKKVL